MHWFVRGLAVCALLVATAISAALAQAPSVPLPLPAPEPPPPPPACGTRPMTIARMQWPAAEVLAAIHAQILEDQFGCTVKVVAGDLAATSSSMAANGRPAIAPELWLDRVSEIWNAAVKAQSVRAGAATYGGGNFEGWYVPGYVEAAVPQISSVETLKANWGAFSGTFGKPKFISCPADWACAVINRNLLRAYGLADKVQLVVPDNRYAFDKAIAKAISRREPFFFYYWQPNAVLAQLDLKPLGMGGFRPKAFKCLGQRDCAAPQPSAFPNEPVTIGMADWVASEAPKVAAYLQKATMPFDEMNALLAWRSEKEADSETVARRFVADRPDIWKAWVGAE